MQHGSLVLDEGERLPNAVPRYYAVLTHVFINLNTSSFVQCVLYCTLTTLQASEGNSFTRCYDVDAIKDYSTLALNSGHDSRMLEAHGPADIVSSFYCSLTRKIQSCIL